MKYPYRNRRYVDQWNRIESLETALLIYNQLDFNKGAKAI